MKIYVDLDHVDITEYTQVESGEYNTQKINFIFTPEYKDLVKVAIFGCKLDTEEPKFYKIYLSDDSCYLPQEVTATSDVISIGVYAFDVDNGELKLRYSPTPVKTVVYEGSFREEAENSSSPTPTEIEQIMSRIISLEELTSDLDTRVEDLESKSCDLETIKEDVEKLKDDVNDISDRLDSVEGDLADTYSKTEVDTLLDSKVDTTTFNTSQEAQDEKIAKAELILSQLPKVTGEGTNISLSPTIEYDLDIKAYKGDIEQDTLNGYNLMNATTQTQTLNGVTCTNNGNGTFTINGTATSQTLFNLEVMTLDTSQTYTLSGCPTGGSGTTYFIGGANFGDYGNGATATPSRASITFAIVIQNGYTANNLVFKPMLEKGSTKHDFEPYCGGIPSPNPNYPQDIQVVTGTQTVTISNADNTEIQTYTLHLGDLELAKIGNYQDKIYYDNGKWYLRKEIGKFYGKDLNWIYYSIQIGTEPCSLFRTPGVSPQIVVNGNGLSNYYTKAINQYNRYNPCFYINIDNPLIDVVDNRFTNANDFKEFCTQNNVVFYTWLSEPSITEITNSTLIEELNSLYNAYSKYGTTNILVEGTLAGGLKVRALKGE